MFNALMRRFPIWGFLLLATGLMAASGYAGWFVTGMATSSLHRVQANWLEFVSGPSSRVMMLTDISRKQGLGGSAQYLGRWLETGDPETASLLIAALDEIAFDFEIYQALEPSEEELAILEPLIGGLFELRGLVENDGSRERARDIANEVQTAIVDLNVALQSAYAKVADRLQRENDIHADDLVLSEQVIIAATAIAIVIFAVMQVFGVSRPIIRMSRRLRSQDNADWTVELGGCREFRQFVEAYRDQRDRAAKAKKQTTSELAFELQARVQGLIEALSESGDLVRDEADQLKTRTTSQFENFNLIYSDVKSIAERATRCADGAVQLRDVLGQNEAALMKSQDISKEANTILAGSRQAVSELAELIAEIQEFTGQIETVADQTNMLAINASIEAARAGSAGEGFAVVAREVRGLAGRTSQMTSSIETQLAKLKKVGGNCGQSIEGLAEALKRVVDVTDDVQTSMGSNREKNDSIIEGGRSVSAVAEVIIPRTESAKEAANDTELAVDSLRAAAERVHQTSEGVRETLNKMLDRLWAA